jgi:hypothetical protein
MVEVFPIVASPIRWIWVFWALTVLLVGLAALCGWLAVNTGRVSFEVSELGVRIRGDLFGRQIPAQQLRLADARVLDLAAAPEYRPRWRTMGTALPGYRGGWFRLRNGEKALVFMTAGERVAYVPTGEGWALMVTVDDPEAFLHALGRAAGG